MVEQDIWGLIWDRAYQEAGWVQVFRSTGGHLLWANHDWNGILQGDDIFPFITNVSLNCSFQIPSIIQLNYHELQGIIYFVVIDSNLFWDISTYLLCLQIS